MPQNSLAKRAVTNFAVKATPSILAHVVGNAMGAGELSKVTNSICDTIKTVSCKDRIVMAEAIKARTSLDAAVCNKYMTLLYDAIQVYTESNCKDYSLIVETILKDPDASLDKKVQYVLDVKKAQHEDTIKLLETVGGVVITVGGVVITVRLAFAASTVLEELPLQLPALADKAAKIHNQDAKVKIVEAKEQGKVARVKAKEQGKVARANIKQQGKKK